MADIIQEVGKQLPAGTKFKYEDIGDGVHAPVQAVVAVDGTATLGATKDAGPNWSGVMGGTNQVCFTDNDATDNPTLIAAPAAGLKLVITDLVISVDTAMSLTFSEQTSGTVLLKVYMAANTTLQFTPRSKMKLTTAAKALMVDASAAGNVAIQYWYYTEA